MKRRFGTLGWFLMVFPIVVLTSSPAFCSGEASGRGALSLTILHVNDTHGHLLPDGGGFKFEGRKIYFEMGGYARLVSKIIEVRSDTPNTLLLHAGDAIQGSLFGFMNHGKSAIDFMNFIAFDAMVVGNHEFDFGLNVLVQRIQQARFPVLGANVDASSDPDLERLLKPYVIKEIEGRKIGIIGLVTPETAHASRSGKDVVFKDTVQAARKRIAELAAQKVDKIVLLTHLGYEADLKLAGEVEGVDVIVGGHSHTLLGKDTGLFGLKPQGPYPTVIENESKVCVVQAWEHAYCLGRLDVDFDEQGRVTRCVGGSPVLIDHFKAKNAEGKKVALEPEALEPVRALIDQNPSVVQVVTEDLETSAHLETYVKEVQAIRNVVIGRAAQALPGGSAYRVPSADGNKGSPEGCRLAAHICSSMLDKLRDNNIDVRISLQNAGGIRKSLNQGDIKLSDAYDILPFSNTLILLELTGRDLKKTIENAIAMATRENDPSSGAFPYLGGARYEAGGGDVTAVEVETGDGKWEPVNPEAVYKLVTNSFLAGGGDNYQTLAQSSASHYDTGFIDNVAFIEYVKNKKVLEPMPTNVNYNGLNPF